MGFAKQLVGGIEARERKSVWLLAIQISANLILASVSKIIQNHQ